MKKQIAIYPDRVYNKQHNIPYRGILWKIMTILKNGSYYFLYLNVLRMEDYCENQKEKRDNMKNHMDDLEICCCKTKERSPKEYKDLINRLNRIEGQIRGIKGMVERDAYCPDILVQVAAANAALNSFNKVLLANHIKTCVIRDIKEGKEETVEELLTTLQKLMK